MAARPPAPLRLVPQIHRATHRIGLHIASAIGTTQAEAHVLQHLASHGDCTVGDLHRAFAHRRSTLTSVLDRLADGGCIARRPSDADRRTFVVSLTPAGRRSAVRVHADLERVEARALAGLSARDLKGFAAVLGALEKTLETSGDPA